MRDFENLTCRYTQLLLWDYLAGRLPEERMEDVERHVALCEPCQKELSAMRKTFKWMEVVRKAEVPTPRSSWLTLRARLLQEQLVPATTRKQKAPVALVVPLFLLCGFLMGHFLSNTTTLKPATTTPPKTPNVVANGPFSNLLPPLGELPSPLNQNISGQTYLNTTEIAPDVSVTLMSKHPQPYSRKSGEAVKRQRALKPPHPSSSKTQVARANFSPSVKSRSSKPRSNGITDDEKPNRQNHIASTQLSPGGALASFVLTSLQPDVPDRQSIY